MPRLIRWLTLASVAPNYWVSVQGSAVDGTPLTVSLLVEIELRRKDKRVGRDDKNTKVLNFRGKIIT